MVELCDPTARLVWPVRRAGQYTAIIKDVLNFPHGEIRSIIIKVQHNCTSDRKSYGKLEDPPIKHEYCVVFKKPLHETQAPPLTERCLSKGTGGR